MGRFSYLIKKGMRFGYDEKNRLKNGNEIDYFYSRLFFGFLSWQLFRSGRHFQSRHGVGHFAGGWFYCADHFYHC